MVELDHHTAFLHDLAGKVAQAVGRCILFGQLFQDAAVDEFLAGFHQGVVVDGNHLLSHGLLKDTVQDVLVDGLIGTGESLLRADGLQDFLAHGRRNVFLVLPAVHHGLGEFLHLGLVIIPDYGTLKARGIHLVLAAGAGLAVCFLDGVAYGGDKFLQTGMQDVLLPEQYFQEVQGKAGSFHFRFAYADFLHGLGIAGQHLLSLEAAGNKTGVVVLFGAGLPLLFQFIHNLAQFHAAVLKLFDLGLRLGHNGFAQFQEVIEGKRTGGPLVKEVGLDALDNFIGNLLAGFLLAGEEIGDTGGAEAALQALGHQLVELGDGLG